MELATNLQIGVWLDDLRTDLKAAFAAVGPLKPECVGLDAFSAELSPRALGRSGRRDAAHFIRSRGSTLVALRADVGGRRLADAASLDVNLARLRDAWELAGDLGAAHLVVPSGYVPAADDKDGAQARRTLAEATRVLATMSSSGRVRVCWLGGQENPEVLAAFLHECDSAGILEVDLNPGAYLMRGIDPLKALQALSERVAMARAADHYRGGSEAPFGSGDVRWSEIVVSLSTLSRSAPLPLLAACTLDGDRLRLISAGYERLKALRANPF